MTASEIKPLFNHVICRKPDQKQIENKTVTDVWWRGIESCGEKPFRQCDVTQSWLNMYKQNNYFPAIHMNLICDFIDFSFEINDFEKYMYTGHSM